MYIAFARQSKDGQYSGERLVNWFLRPTEGSVGQGTLIARGGLMELASTSGQRARAITKMAGDIYTVSGSSLWKYSVSAGTATEIGGIPDGDVSMAASGDEVAIVVSGTYYIYDGTTLASHSTGAVTAPQAVEFSDGYFVVSGTASGRADAITISALNDGKTFDAAEFAFAENAPDAIRGMILNHNQLHLFGVSSAEIFQNRGGSFPFKPSRSQYLEKGSLSGQVITKRSGWVYWVGSDRAVYRSAGAGAETVSTPEIKEQLDASTITGVFSFIDRGHEFVAVRREGASTFCLDVMTGLWAERTTGVGEFPWVATCAVDLDGVAYFGTEDGKICTLTADDPRDLGQTVVAEAISQPITNNGGEEFVITRLEMRAIAPNSDLVSSPTIMLQTSHNGVEWGVEQERSLGRDTGGKGSYNTRVTWHGQGVFDRAQVRIRISDPVRRDIFGMTYD